VEATADKERLDQDFTELYRAHLRDVYSYAYYRVGNHHDAEDLTEQTFLRPTGTSSARSASPTGGRSGPG
jgi:DNA-directed RNA polymerase specialized sigma24 family protein